MTASFPKHQKIFRIPCLLLLIAYLYGCGSSPEKPPIPGQAADAAPVITEAPAQLPPSEFRSQFNTAEQYLLAFDWMAASHSLAQLPAAELQATDIQYLQYLQARIHYIKGENTEAEQVIETLRALPLNSAIGEKVDNFQRHILSMSGRALASARLGDHMLRKANPDQDTALALKKSIWRDLQRVSPNELRHAMDSSSEPRWLGWLSLSLITTVAEDELELRQNLTHWINEHPDHPAASVLPGGLQHLMDQPATFQHVALMLPLSGRLAPAAKAVRDGYLSSYYSARRADSENTQLQLVDLDRYDSAIQAYNEAVLSGAQLVIGPLSKHEVSVLGNHPGRSVPVLALNRADTSLPTSNMGLVQLALAPEDEAQQIANLAFGQGARRAVVIRPLGNWGDKMERALVDQWTRLGGEIGDTGSYSSQEDYSSSMAAALGIPESEQRARDIRNMLATNIEFTTRRRQDLDAVFLLSRDSAEARSLKPLLAYHYAGDLPVYSTSSIHRGMPDTRDKDLNGVQLVEIPWLLGSNTRQRAALASTNEGGDSYSRLNALGSDAYLLQTRFSQLEAGADVQIRGSTGLLSLDPQLRIHRELQPAIFDGGILTDQ